MSSARSSIRLRWIQIGLTGCGLVRSAPWSCLVSSRTCARKPIFFWKGFRNLRSRRSFCLLWISRRIRSMCCSSSGKSLTPLTQMRWGSNWSESRQTRNWKWWRDSMPFSRGCFVHSRRQMSSTWLVFASQSRGWRRDTSSRCSWNTRTCAARRCCRKLRKSPRNFRSESMFD